MIETIRNESKIFKEEIKKIDTLIKTKQNKIIVLKIEKQKLEKEIQKLETNKGGRNFSNKFWGIISCGRFNNSRSNEIKQQKKQNYMKLNKRFLD